MMPALRHASLRDSIETRLSRRILLVLVAVLTSVSLAFLGLAVWTYKQELVAEHSRASLEVNHLLQASLENAMLKRDIPGLRDIVDRLGNQASIDKVMILNPDREVRFSSKPELMGAMLAGDEVDRALSTQVSQTTFVSQNGGEWLRSVNPVTNKASCRECHGDAASHPVNGLLVVDYVAAGIRGDAMRTAGLLGLSGVIVVALSGLGLWVALDRLVLGRIDRLTKVAGRLASGALDARAVVAGRDEISECASAFNGMADRLQDMLGQVAATERFLQAAIDAIPDGIRIVDDDFTILKANTAYCRQVGRSKKQVIGSKCYASSHGRREPCPQTLVSCPVIALRDKSDGRMKMVDAHQPRHAPQLFVEVSAARALLPSQGRMLPCVVESIRDLSQDVELSQKHRLSEIGLLATGVAHEIHNPLSSIELALSAIRDTLSNEHEPSGAQHYIDIARTEIGKCMGVTESLMRLSEPPREPELVILNAVLREVVQLLAYQIGTGQIVVHIDLAQKLRIIASDSDMRMIFINLIQNAIHAMPQGGELRVSGQTLGGFAVLRVADTGIGIPNEHLDKIFLPFWTRRADGSTGRGLGLSICKAIVERYGGAISVDSIPGKGSEFTVALPAADAPKTAATRAKAGAGAGDRG